MPLLQNRTLAKKVKVTLEAVAFTPEGHKKRELHRSPFEMLLWSDAIVRCWEQEEADKAIRIAITE